MKVCALLSIIKTQTTLRGFEWPIGGAKVALSIGGEKIKGGFGVMAGRIRAERFIQRDDNSIVTGHIKITEYITSTKSTAGSVIFHLLYNEVKEAPDYLVGILIAGSVDLRLRSS